MMVSREEREAAGLIDKRSPSSGKSGLNATADSNPKPTSAWTSVRASGSMTSGGGWRGGIASPSAATKADAASTGGSESKGEDDSSTGTGVCVCVCV
jgi:hypothetical protein